MSARHPVSQHARHPAQWEIRAASINRIEKGIWNTKGRMLMHAVISTLGLSSSNVGKARLLPGAQQTNCYQGGTDCGLSV